MSSSWSSPGPVPPPAACRAAGCPGEDRLRRLVEATLREQGLDPAEPGRRQPRDLDKDSIRRANRAAVATRRAKAEPRLARHEPRLLERYADGCSLDPMRIRPRLVEVETGSEEELLFRYSRLHWSIPVSAGYGRRLRYLVVDEHNDKLVGLLGLGDPVFALAARDAWVGWERDTRRRNLRHVMEAFVLGAVPPYNDLLCGKLVALLATSNEVREAFRAKYAGRPGSISGRPFTGELAALTTASALGRSSIYNRLTYRGDPAFVSVGFSAGSGEFHFADGTYDEMLAFAEHHCARRTKKASWGTGWRNRREAARAALGALGLSRELVYHGVQRELFVAPLGTEAAAFLRGESLDVDHHDRPAGAVCEWFRDRWLTRRAAAVTRYRGFDPESLRLWGR